MITQWQQICFENAFYLHLQGFILGSHIFPKSGKESSHTMFLCICYECEVVQLLCLFASDSCCCRVFQCLKNQTPPFLTAKKKFRAVFCSGVEVYSGVCVFICVIILFLFISNHSMRAHHCNLTFQKDQHPTLRSLSERLQHLRARNCNSVKL